MPAVRSGEEREARFWPKVDFDGPAFADRGACWLWCGKRASTGYAIFANPPSMSGHRFAYRALIGPVPAGLQLDHLCRNRSCVNPFHLEPVTPRENILRGMSPAAECARRRECPRGHELKWVRWNGGRRVCRTCQNAAIKRWKQRKKAQAV